MTDQWVPAPPQPPPPPPPGLPPANSWSPVTPCAAADSPSIAAGVIITGVPATILAPNAWGITLNDGETPPNFSIDHYDAAGALIEHPIVIDGASGDVLLTHDPTQDLGAATKHYADNNPNYVPEAPLNNTTYGRDNGAWVALPQSYMPEAPNTSTRFGRFNSTWQPDAIQTDAPSDGTAYARQSAAWVPAVTGGPYMPISGGTFTGVVIFPSNNSIAINGPINTAHAILGQVAGLNRWQLQMPDQTTEGVGNAGANFSLSAFSTTGGFLGTWLTIARADGTATFASSVNVNGGLAVNGLLAVNSLGNFYLPGGTNGQVLATNGSGVLSWATRLSDAPSDGQFYTRQNAAWAVAPGGMTDAPNDGTAYARKSAAWAHLTHTDITDWTATLAPYALTAAVPPASTTVPLMDGTAAVGSGAAFARNDHVHPTDTSRYAASNPSGFQTAAQVTASLANYLPLAGGTVTGALGISGATAQIQIINPSTNPIIYLDDGISTRSAYYFETATGRTEMADLYSGSALYLDPAGTFTYLGDGTAVKTGGGSWTAASDARIKTVEGDYPQGLEAILALRPVVYAYKGNDSLTADEPSPHARAAATGARFIGLVAQEAEIPMPEMVGRREGFIDGEAVTDLRTLDVSPLVYALVNSVKTLAARVAELEAARG